PVEPLFCPRLSLSAPEVTAPLFDHQAAEPEYYVVVGLAEFIGGVPGAEVVAPAAQQRIQVRDHLTDVLHSDAVAAGAVPDLGPEPFHRLLRGPAVQVVAHDPLLFPQPPRHAGVKMAAEKVQALPALPEVHYFRFSR